MDLATCIKCGEDKVEPMNEADVQVGIIYHYGIPICKECFEDMADDELNKLLEQKDLPF